jgi:ubiquinone/menaquinone biosynthesis C-methylase UbiE
MNESFNENSFDLIIEKAGLDSIATKESEDMPFLLKSVFSQIYSVLKPGGYLLSFSIKNPEFWHTNVYEKMSQQKMFRVVRQELTVFYIENNKTLANLYFYQLKSLKD